MDNKIEKLNQQVYVGSETIYKYSRYLVEKQWWKHHKFWKVYAIQSEQK